MKRLFHGIIFIISVILLSGCERSSKPVSRTDFVMDTVATITIFEGVENEKAQERALPDQCFDEVRRYERLFSAEIPGSDVDRINEAKGEPVEVSAETAELIDIALKYSRLTKGTFDITIRPVSKLWDFKSAKGKVPPDEDIQKALRHVGYEKIILDKDKHTVTKTDPETEIDLGGIAKGYTADRIKEFLVEKGVKSAIINLGGNVLLIGSKPDGSDFSVGIEKPFGMDGEMITTISRSDSSIVTSGNYERYFKENGKLYHHILDTKTGYPVESGLNAVTIISEYSADGDALSTSCFCLGREKSEEFLKKFDGVKAYFTDKDNKIRE